MSDAAPAISVLVPAWNEAALIGECLADIRAQRLPPAVTFECVIALDGPTDATAEIVRANLAGDARFVVLPLPHRGLVATLNDGLAACRAPIVARMDADDRMHPSRLARQLEAFAADPDVAVVTCEVAYDVVGAASPSDIVSPAAAGPGMARHVEWLNTLRTAAALRNARFVDAPLAHPAVAYRKDVVVAAGGYRDGDFAEDHDLWLRLFERGVRFGFAGSGGDGALVTWRDRPGRATRADARYGAEPRRALVHRHLVAGPLAGGARHVRIWGAGAYGRWHGKHLRATGVVIDDFIEIDPKKVGRVLLGDVPVVARDALGPPDDRLVLACVATPGARAIIAGELAGRGYVAGRDWLALQ